MHQSELIPGLFRAEFSKICSVLTTYMGLGHLQTAEDIASETFVAALETWTYNGIPENPVAWLYVVSKNKARNYLHRTNLFAEKIAGDLMQSDSITEEPDIDWSDQNISDSQLRMLFAICYPSIPVVAQIGLALRILCGFGIDEIASAFLTNKETINKRLFRAREKLREIKMDISYLPDAAIQDRLETVLTTLYLLYNEGYYSESNESLLRQELCLEAMRLTYLLIGNERTNLPCVNALFALMCFHSSRFPARKSTAEKFVLYADQDETLWNHDLIAKGAYYLHLASRGNTISKYHLEASIAYWHTIKEDTTEKWETILQLYNQLLQIEYSPIAALNRTYALSKANGNEEAILEAEKLQLKDNQYYFTLLGVLYKDIDRDKSKICFEKAHSLARTQIEKKTILNHLDKSEY